MAAAKSAKFQIIDILTISKDLWILQGPHIFSLAIILKIVHIFSQDRSRTEKWSRNFLELPLNGDFTKTNKSLGWLMMIAKCVLLLSIEIFLSNLILKCSLQEYNMIP